MNQIYDTQLGLKSFVEISVLTNIGTGIVAAIVYALSYMLIGFFSTELFRVLLIPLCGIFTGLVGGLAGYPFYSWWCKRYKGHRVTGIFVETDETNA